MIGMSLGRVCDLSDGLGALRGVTTWLHNINEYPSAFPTWSIHSYYVV